MKKLFILLTAFISLISFSQETKRVVVPPSKDTTIIDFKTTTVTSSSTTTSYTVSTKPVSQDTTNPADTTTPSGYALLYSNGFDKESDMDPDNKGQRGNGYIDYTNYATGPGSFRSRPDNVSSGYRSEVQFNSSRTPSEGMIEYDVKYNVIEQDGCHSVQFHPNTSGGSASPGLWHINGQWVWRNWTNSGGNTTRNTGITIQPGKWYHLKFEYKFGASGYFRFYIDGVYNSGGSWTGRVGDGSGQYFKLGVNGGFYGTSTIFNSDVQYDNLKIYRKL